VSHRRRDSDHWEATLSTERHDQILEYLEHAGSATVGELVDRFGVTGMTIRRDLAQLADQGLLRRFHGGAMLDRRRSYEPPYVLRESRQREEKERIAKAAATFVTDGDSVALDFGTTATEVARRLAARSNLSVVTANVRAALELAGTPSVRVLLSGGMLRGGEQSLSGREAEMVFERHFVDIAFFGAAGIDPDRGFTDYVPENVAVKQAMLASARRVIAIADSSKLGVVAFTAVAGLGDIDTLITTADPDDPVVKELADRGLEVHAV
jgi:DeoR/GlpR family transcriptional regulator of sugar metabolism